MELAQITAGQVVMLFLLMGTGIAAVKTGVLKPEGKQTLSNLLVYLVVPAMIVNSYRMEFSMEILHNLLAAVRMLLIPAVCLAVFGLLGFRSMTAQVVLLRECRPSAAITSVFAVQFGHDESFAAGSVVLTTLLSIVALPLCALVVTLL